MFALFHFVFQVLKIAVQATAYATIIILLKKLLVRSNSIERYTFLNFETIYFYIYVLLFLYSFTYYGDHGLGDEARIPLGNSVSINASDGYPYLHYSTTKEINIDSFLVRKGYLCFASNNKYYSYDIDSHLQSEFNTQASYDTYATIKGLPRVNEFKTFYSQYDVYWSGWRFWLLP